ncbi:MAG: glycosyltransferase family 4 protein [Candidatus Micrarchaeales archaeon]
MGNKNTRAFGDVLDICVLNPFFYPYKGGTEKFILELYKRLAKKHNVTIITSAPIDRNKHSVEELFGIKVVRLRTFQEHISIFPMPFLFFDGLTKALIKEKSDIYHINNRYQFFEDTVYTVKRMNKKIALTIHNALPRNIDPLTDQLGGFYDVLWGRRLMKAADLITGVSTNTIRTTVPRSELYKTHLVFNGVDYKKFRKIGRNNDNVMRVTKKLGFDDGINIVSNGRLVIQKGQKYLLRAVSSLVKEGYDLNLMLIGKGPLKNSLHRMAKRVGMHDRFKIIYGLDDDSLPYYYNACDIFSLPSLYEPAGLALLEALSCELPSVISRVGGMPELAGDSALYSKPKDYHSIRDRLRYALDNKDICASIASSGRKRMIRYHDWDRIAKKYESLFLNTIKY